VIPAHGRPHPPVRVDAPRKTIPKFSSKLKYGHESQLGARGHDELTNWIIVSNNMTWPAYPVWRSAARSHVRKLQVLQSKYLRIATNAPWYVGNRQIHEDLGIPFYADHIRALTESFWWGEPLSSVTWKAPTSTKGCSEVPHGQPKRADVQQASRGHPYKAAKSTQCVIPNTDLLPWLRFSVLFLSCKANARV
jgi:hypothetical protein